MPLIITVPLRVRVWVALVSLGCTPQIAVAQSTNPSQTIWNARDIGAPPIEGSSTISANQIEISSGTTNISGGVDQFRFVYQLLSDQSRIVTRIDAIVPDDSAMAGLMMRSSLQADARQGSVLINDAGTVVFARRKQNGGGVTRTQRRVYGTGPYWLALERTGTRIVASSSLDGQRWNTIASDWVDLGATIYAGLAVPVATSQPTTARMSQVSVTGLRSGQSQRDIGYPSTPGSGSQTDGVFTISSSGAFAVTRDQLHLIYQTVQGDVDVVARVASLTSLNQDSQAGVMIRESSRSDARHAFVFLTAGHGYGFDRRTQPAWPTEHIDGELAAVPGWVRLVRRGTTFEAFASPDGATWTSIGSAEIAMKNEVYVGLAVASQDDAVRATAAIDRLAVTIPSADDGDEAGNLAPTVALATPVSGSTFDAPATIAISADAADPEGRLSQVRFLANGTEVGSSAAAPYTINWSSVPAGAYTLTAVATDADGNTTTSAPVSMDVVEPANQAPSVALTSPAGGASFTAPATITLTASASDPERRLARVDFYRGTTQLGSATAAPYSFTWSSVPAGSYTLTAVATDLDGGSATSGPVTITVNAPPPPPPPPPPTARVAFTASTDHDNGVTSYLLEVFASGADPNTAAPNASSDLGKPAPDANREVVIDRTAFFNGLAAGNYIVTVTAVGPGGRTRSASVSYSR